MRTGPASPRNAAVAAWAFAALALVLAATVPVSVSGGVASRPEIDNPGMWSDYWVHVLIVMAFTASGAALIHMRPRNLIGWVLLARTRAEAEGAVREVRAELPLGRP